MVNKFVDFYNSKEGQDVSDELCSYAEIVRDVVEARAELFASAAERGAAAGAPPNSITPPSPPSPPDPDPEEESRQYLDKHHIIT